MDKHLLSLIVLLTIIFEPATYSQNPVTVKALTGAESFLTFGDQSPLWMTSRQQGRWNQIDNNQIISYAAVAMDFSAGKHWNFKTEAELDYSSGKDLVYLHTGNIQAAWRDLSLTAGRHLFSPIFDHNYLGSGSYLFGNNYRPLTRITIGIPNYSKVPFTNSRLEVRGEISHGSLDDGDGFYNHKDEILHEKYAYMRWNGGNWLPYMGLNHSLIIGGYYPNGEKIPIDYWPSFLAKGSQKIGGGDATNAAGAHMGLFDFGIYRKLNDGEIQFYYQIPFSDRSGMFFWNRNSDQITGINIALNGKKAIKNLTIEWVNTTHQSGNGTPDPVIIYPDGIKDLESLTIAQLRLRDLDELMSNLGQVRGEPYTLNEVVDFLKKKFNNGQDYGGRDGYLNNGTYPAGWTNHGDIMGSPLNLVRNQIAHKKPNLGTYAQNSIINDRIKAIHIGSFGYLTDLLRWKGMVTYSVNYGSYFNQYPGRYTWNETDNYYFKGGLNQFYSLFGIDWQPTKDSKFEIGGNLSLDVGDIFNSLGMKLTTRWHIY